ncbi:2-oxo acid dehydrogenase subunit E2 [Halioglobus maricola]|uniref:Dihydrolipoamide acetyltransferase component of pyruvate dehydrogenase complex n=1 Tax=Halioglobus maricola TaxID=2601894 RepID=A0A5P9NNY2_9GAMM|nr:dihydrolipoamide acetyltransferase family protein [Halioglobus maricola]QFU77206.1 2-oxo acid dehydrogenase subunit E2 [Halioglobus maricola]
MTSIPLILPALGDDASTSGEIISLSEAGSSLRRGDIYLEVETDKVVVEVPAESDGIISRLSVDVGDTVAGGDEIGEITLGSTEETDKASPKPDDSEAPQATEGTQHSIKADVAHPVNNAATDTAETPTTAAGPAARRQARKLGINIEDVKGTGTRGRVTKEDIIEYAKYIITAKNSGSNPGAAARELPDISQFGHVSREKLSGIAKATSRNMQFAWSEIPHAWVQEEIDITELEQLRKQVKAQTREPIPLTITAILCKVMALALKNYPHFNAVLDRNHEELILRDYINIGVAVDTPRGLVVPGIRNVNEMNAIQIGHELKNLSEKAKASKLAEKDFQGTGFTISNLGGVGVSGMFPVVNWPEVAILGVSSSREQCRLSDGQVENRLMMPLTLGFDHRVINGADAARFLGFVKRIIEQPATLLIET